MSRLLVLVLFLSLASATGVLAYEVRRLCVQLWIARERAIGLHADCQSCKRAYWAVLDALDTLLDADPLSLGMVQQQARCIRSQFCQSCGAPQDHLALLSGSRRCYRCAQVYYAVALAAEHAQVKDDNDHTND